MSKSISIYERTISSLSEYRTLSSHMTALGKIKVNSEDTIVTKMITLIAYDLRKAHMDSYYKSSPLSLENSRNQIICNLIQYCHYMIGEKKPDWQILAERHGWKPPQSF